MFLKAYPGCYVENELWNARFEAERLVRRLLQQPERLHLGWTGF